MEFEEINILIDKYLSGTATEEERTIVERWYGTVAGEEGLFNEQQLADVKSDMREAVFSRIKIDKQISAGTSRSGSTQLFNYLKWTAAAVLFLGISITLYYNNTNKNQQEKDQLAAIYKNDIAPGGNKAVLTLADGSTVLLDDANNGNLASQGNTVIKKADGRLTYHNDKQAAASEKISYNSVATPRGGQYVVVLSDGTKVWLNAASSLKYPTSFKGKERNVELSGEGYFEVAKNAAMPFHVTTEGQTIEVLGTHFNVHAYQEDAVAKTTLLEGSVKVVSDNKAAVLKPGQQCNIMNTDKGSQIQVVNLPSTDEAVAWKNGLLQFEDADIKTIMNQIGRWYDVDIEYEGKVPQDHYNGKVPRNVNVSQVLRILEISGINFKIEGKKIIVK